jgi:outer membrane protein TolC
MKWTDARILRFTYTFTLRFTSHSRVHPRTFQGTFVKMRENSNILIHLIKYACGLIYALIFSGVSLCYADASLDQFIRLAINNNPKIMSSLQGVASRQANYENIRKGLGYRTDLELSYLKDDQILIPNRDIVRSTLFNEASDCALTMSQIFPTGTSFSLFVNYSRNDNPYTHYIHSSNDFSYGIMLRQELLVPSQLQLNIERARIEVIKMQLESNLILRSIVLEISEAYFQYLLSKEDVSIRKKSLDVATSIAEFSFNLFATGISSEVDLLEAKTSMSFAEVNLQQALVSAKASNNNLLRLCNAKESELPDLTDVSIFHFHPVNIPLSDETNPEAANFPSLQILRKRIDLLSVEIKDEQGKFQHKLILEGGYKRSHQRNSSLEALYDIRHEGWAVGVSYKIPLWDNHVTKHAVASIQGQIKQFEYDIETLSRKIDFEISNLLHSMRMRDQTIQTLDRTIKYAESNLLLMNKKYSRGLATVHDVIRAESNLTEGLLKLASNIAQINSEICKIEYYRN